MKTCYICNTEIDLNRSECIKCDTPIWYTLTENIRFLILFFEKEGLHINLRDLIFTPEDYEHLWRSYNDVKL